jgi:hypothetical protein
MSGLPIWVRHDPPICIGCGLDHGQPRSTQFADVNATVERGSGDATMVRFEYDPLHK